MNILFFANNTISKSYTTLLLALAKEGHKVGVVCIGRARKRYYDMYFKADNVYDVLKLKYHSLVDLSYLEAVKLEVLLGDRKWLKSNKQIGDLRILAREFSGLKMFYDGFKPDVMVGENASVYSDYISNLNTHKYFLTFYHGINYAKNKIYYTLDGNSNPALSKNLYNLEIKSRSNNKSRDRHIYNDAVIDNRKYFRQNFCRFWYDEFRDRRSVYSEGLIWYSLSKIVRRLNKFVYTTLDHLLSSRVEGDFVLYYLQFDEDMSLLRWSFIRDQLDLIQGLSDELEGRDIQIVVKEHPFAVGTRNLLFYMRLMMMRNVTLIKMTADRDVLLNKCLGVVTITGTVGREALSLKKKVAAFGHPYYKSVNLINTSSCKTAIDFILGETLSSSSEVDTDLLGLSAIDGSLKNFIDGKVPFSMLELVLGLREE